MAVIAQLPLFQWDQLDQQDDLHRLRYVLNAIPDESLVALLELRRGHGRNDYPVRAMWNALLAGIVFQHVSIESLRRELQRNPSLRHLCGFHAFGVEAQVPTASAFSRFLVLLMDCQVEVDAMFDRLVVRLMEILPDFGRHLAGDSKAIASHGRPHKSDSDDAAKASRSEPGRRRDTDADWGKKTTRGVRKDGTKWEKVTKWFGYKMHLIVDSRYELPVVYQVTAASASDVVPMRDDVLPALNRRHPELIRRCEAAMFDRGYDDTDLVVQLQEDYGIEPIIDKRNSWKHGKTTMGVPGQPGVYYDQKGQVFCWSHEDGQSHAMAYGGYEKDRASQKFRCPARHYGQSCASSETCRIGSGSGQVRVPLSIDRRVFTPVARSSHRWKKLYAERSAVERMNGRIDQNLGFERHYIRGKKKMTLRVGLALVVTLAMALGRIEQDQTEHMRSLVRPAA